MHSTICDHIDITPKSKPPLGLMPKCVWQEQRLDEVSAAIERRMKAFGYEIPIEWIEEYNELMNIIQTRKFMENES